MVPGPSEDNHIKQHGENSLHGVSSDSGETRTKFTQSLHSDKVRQTLRMNQNQWTKSYLPPTIELPQFPLFLVKAAGSHVAVCWSGFSSKSEFVRLCRAQRSVAPRRWACRDSSCPVAAALENTNSSGDWRWAPRADWASPHTLPACVFVSE